MKKQSGRRRASKKGKLEIEKQILMIVRSFQDASLCEIVEKMEEYMDSKGSDPYSNRQLIRYLRRLVERGYLSKTMNKYELTTQGYERILSKQERRHIDAIKESKPYLMYKDASGTEVAVGGPIELFEEWISAHIVSDEKAKVVESVLLKFPYVIGQELFNSLFSRKTTEQRKIHQRNLGVLMTYWVQLTCSLFDKVNEVENNTEIKSIHAYAEYGSDVSARIKLPDKKGDPKWKKKRRNLSLNFLKPKIFHFQVGARKGHVNIFKGGDSIPHFLLIPPPELQNKMFNLLLDDKTRERAFDLILQILSRFFDYFDKFEFHEQKDITYGIQLDKNKEKIDLIQIFIKNEDFGRSILEQSTEFYNSFYELLKQFTHVRSKLTSSTISRPVVVMLNDDRLKDVQNVVEAGSIFLDVFLHTLLNSKFRDKLYNIKQIIKKGSKKKRQDLRFDLDQIHYGILNFFLNLWEEGEQSLVKIPLHDKTMVTLEYLPREKSIEFEENLRKKRPWVKVFNTPPDKTEEVAALVKKFNNKLHETLQIA